MLHNTADCEADVERFVKRVAAKEIVWYLHSPHGTAYCESHHTNNDNEPFTVLLFFSDEAYAQRCQKAHFDDYEVQSMPLFDFLFRWLPGMSRDGVLAGPNWNKDLVGLELDPIELRERVDIALTPAQSAAHTEAYRRLTGANS